MLNGRYPDSNIEAAAAAFALIMSKLRISDDMNGDFWPYWIHFILDKLTGYSHTGYSASEQAKRSIFCQQLRCSLFEKHWTLHGVLYTKQILIVSTFMELNGFMIGPEIKMLFKIKVGAVIAEHPVVPNQATCQVGGA